MEKLDKDSLVFTTVNEENRYLRLKNIKPSNNLRDVYIREMTMQEQNEILYEETNNGDIEFYYNSEKFPNSVQWIIDTHYDSAFSFYEDIADYFDKKGYLKVSHKESTLFTLLYDFHRDKEFSMLEIFIEYLKYDYLMIGKPGFYPEWFQSKKDGELYDEIIREGNYKSIREGHKNSELEKFTYNIFKKIPEEIFIFFDYREKKTRVVKKTLEK